MSMMSFGSSLMLLVALTLATEQSENSAMASTENRLLDLETETNEIVAFVLGENDEVVPVSVDNMASGRRNLKFDSGRFLQTAEPTAADQYMLELINRARANPQAEADVLLGGELNQGLPSGTISTAPKEPLAFNVELWRASVDHSDWMLANNVFSHTGEGASSPTQRMQSAGYVLTPPWSTGENIAYSGTTGTPDLVTFVTNNHGNLVKSPGHRRNLMSESFKEVGVSSLQGQFNNYNSVMTTQKFAFTGNHGPFITGVIYTDASVDNDFYDVGEGIAGITITAEDKQNSANTFTTTSIGTGGYFLDVNPDTDYKVTFSGDLLGDGTSTTAIYDVSVASVNVKQDCVSDSLVSLPNTTSNPPTLQPTSEPTIPVTQEPTSEPSSEPTILATSEPTRAPRWGKWSRWSECSATCGAGTKSRTRSCSGTGCVGKSVRTKACNEGACDSQTGCDWESLSADECPSWFEAWMLDDCNGRLCDAFRHACDGK